MADAGVSLGTAYLQITPSLKGLDQSISRALAPGESIAANAGAKQAKSFGAAFAGGMKKAAIGVAAGAAVLAGVGKGLYEVGAVFDDMTDTIRVGTGASGKALDGLVDSARNVGKNVPASFEDTSVVVADLNTRLGLTGGTLETVASQYLEAGRILGEDVDVAKTTAAFTAFGIEGEAVEGAMDSLFQVSQATGVGMNELAAATQVNAVTMQNLGFTFEDTAAMAGSLDKAGLNSSAVMASMGKAMVTLAKEGENPQEAFKRVTGEIQGFVDTGNTAGALELASKVFGTKGAGQFVGALQSGTLNMEDLMGATGATGDTILGLGQETMDFSEKWQIFKNRALDALEPVGSAVFSLAGVLMDKLIPVFDEVSGGIIAFGAAWKYNDGQVTSSGFPGFMERLGFVARQTFDFFQGTVIPVMRSLVGFLVENKNALIVLATGLLAYKANAVAATVADKARVTWQKAAVMWTNRQALAQKALNFVMNMSPIGRIILALTALGTGLALAYKNIGWFKNGVDAAWAFIKTATAGTFNWITNTAFPAVKNALSSLGKVFSWLHVNVVKPVWTGIRIAVAVVAGILKTIFDGIAWVVRKTLGPAFSWFYNSVIKPVWNGIKAVIGLAWSGIKAYFSAIKWYIDKVLTPVFRFLYNNVVRPVWNNIKAAIKAVGDWFGNVLVPFFRVKIQSVQDKFTGMRNLVRIVWDNVRDKISGVWNFLRDRVFNPLITTVRDKVGAAFNRAKDAVKTAWDKIQGIVKAPVKFVIDTVINGGLIKNINKVLGTFKMKKLAEVSSGFATGGYTGPGSKYQPAGVVHADEFVIRKESQNDLRRNAPGLLDNLNKYGAKALEKNGYAKGGRVRPTSGPVSSGYGPRWGGFHDGIDFAAPTGTPVRAADAGRVKRASWSNHGGGNQVEIAHPDGLVSWYAHLSSFAARVGQMVKAGDTVGRVGSTGNSSGPHLHFSVFQGDWPNHRDPNAFLGGALKGDGTGGGGVFDLLSGAKDKVSGLFDSMKSKFSGPGLDVAMGAGKHLASKAWEWAGSKLEGITDAVSGVVSTAVNQTGGRVKGAAWMAKALRHTGDWSLGNQNSGVRRMGQESGFDVNAINNWDSNASAGTPSKGLMQVIDPTFAAHRDRSLSSNIFDPIANIVASINYTKSRYGSLRAGWDRAGGYADGGLVSPMLHDNGGFLQPGLSLVNNKTGKPEPVFNPSQWETLKNGVGGNTPTYHIENLNALDADDAMRKLRREDQKRRALAYVG